MGDVAVCYKWVIDEADIRVREDESVDVSHARKKISDYDLNAIEAAVQAARRLGGEAVGFTFGDDTVEKSVKDALSRGLDRVYTIHSADSAADGLVTSQVLVSGVTASVDADLIVCSDGASDVFARQTASRMAALLDWPAVTSVIAVEIDDRRLVATRRLDDSLEIVEVSLPAVISVQPEINDAPLPGLKQIMSASKKPAREIPLGDLGELPRPLATVEESVGYVTKRRNTVFDGKDVDAAVESLVVALRKEGVL